METEAERMERLARANLSTTRETQDPSLYGEHVVSRPESTPSLGWPETPRNLTVGLTDDQIHRDTSTRRVRHDAGTIAGWAQSKYNMPTADPARQKHDDKHMKDR